MASKRDKRREPPRKAVAKRTGTSTAALLNEVAQCIRTHVVLDAECVDACALWVYHTYAIDATDTTPYLYVSAPVARCGKTHLLEVLSALAENAQMVSSISESSLFRVIELERPTLLLDEADATFGKAKEYTEGLRQLINSGWRRSGHAQVSVKKDGDWQAKRFSTFCPKGFAGNTGRLPDTIASRAIEIRMKRRTKDEPIEPLTLERLHNEMENLRERLRHDAAENIAGLREATPDCPSGINDRAADGWRLLLAIADLAGGHWPEKARKAAITLSGNDPDEAISDGERVLADLAEIWANSDEDMLSSADLANQLKRKEGSPWDDYHGKGLTPNMLARLLRPFGIQPKTIRFHKSDVLQGYTREIFSDAFRRYVPEQTDTSSS